jgi:Protein of unknown function (DUF1570)
MPLAALTLLAAGLLPAQAPTTLNLDFHTGTLAGWTGEGFYLSAGSPKGPGATWGVCSSDAGKSGRQGLLRYVFVIPDGTAKIRFSAWSAYGKGCPPDDRLDVLLLGVNNKVIPKLVLTEGGWTPALGLDARTRGKPNEYSWNVTGLGGQKVQIAIVDRDERPGCYVYCTGFRFTKVEDIEAKEFATFVRRLEHEHKLPPLTLYESKHFTAWSNADVRYSEMRLNNCELIHSLFFDHFRRRGFNVRPPAYKLMVAVFDSQTGFEAYLGQAMPVHIMGIYHPVTNRLVVYDIDQNRAVVARNDQALEEGKRIRADLARIHYVKTIDRQLRDFANDANIAIIMHEVAHQLSFNCGLLNRQGDVPFWVAEGLACYCEATDQGGWQGIGEPNPERMIALTAQVKANAALIPLQTLVTSDNYHQDARLALLAYGQSWALFRMLMEERPREMRHFLTTIYPRRTPERRLDDFAEAFGVDLARLEIRYQAYIREIVERQPPPRR